MIHSEDIRRVAARIGEAVDAEEVILFGSHARGDARETSDVDFLVIAESDLPRFKRARALHTMFRPYPFAMDILVYTPEEVHRGVQDPLSFVSTVLREGKTVYVGTDGSRQTVARQGKE
jgi:predicted nucleotidyltransferase